MFLNGFQSVCRSGGKVLGDDMGNNSRGEVNFETAAISTKYLAELETGGTCVAVDPGYHGRKDV